MSQGIMQASTNFEGGVNSARKQIKDLAEFVRGLKDGVMNSEVGEKENRGEVMDNMMLTYRHLEDASMRLGKVLQARDGGISVYDKDTTVGA